MIVVSANENEKKHSISLFAKASDTSPINFGTVMRAKFLKGTRRKPGVEAPESQLQTKT
jgi:hypothetical protein